MHAVHEVGKRNRNVGLCAGARACEQRDAAGCWKRAAMCMHVRMREASHSCAKTRPRQGLPSHAELQLTRRLIHAALPWLQAAGNHQRWDAREACAVGIGHFCVGKTHMIYHCKSLL